MADEKPAGVQALCVIAICLGIMGFFGGAFGMVALMINPKTQAPGGANPKLEALNAEFQQKVEKVTRETRPMSMAVIPIMALTSMMLAAAGVAGVKLKALGFIKLAFGASLIVDTIGAVYNIVVQMKTMDIFRWYFKEMSSNSNMPAGVEMGMQVGLYTGLFFGIGWLAVKLAFYIVGLVYFSKAKVKQAFDAAT